MTDATVAPGPSADHQAPLRADTAHALLARVASAQVAGRAPSLVAGIVRDGRLAWSAGRGEVDGGEPTTDTQYRIGSITKPFTAILIMRLRDEGLLGLDDQLEQHLPGTALGELTVRDLLSHSAGLVAEPPGDWWERSPGVPWDELAETLTPDVKITPPGMFHYSNPGYAVLGELIARLRGHAWADALRTEILLPLGMRRTTYGPEAPSATGLAVHPFADVTMPEVVQDLGAMAPAGQLWSTVGDLARFAAFVLGDTGDVLAADTLAEMRQSRVIAEDQGVYAGYGLGLQVLRRGGRELVGHGGSVPGFLAYLLVDVERQVGSVELANTTGGTGVFSGDALLEIVQEREPYVARPWRPVEHLPADVLDAVGVWHWGPNPYVLHARGAHELELVGMSGPGRGSRFVQRDGAWIGTGNYWRGERLTAVRAEDGTISHLDIGTFVFTRLPYDPAAPVPGGVDDRPWPTGPVTA